MGANDVIGMIMAIILSFVMNVICMNWVSISFFDRIKYLHIKHKNDERTHWSTKVYKALNLENCKPDKNSLLSSYLSDDEIGFAWGFQKNNPKWFKITQLVIILLNAIGSVIILLIVASAFLYMLAKCIYYGGKYLWKQTKIWLAD